MRKFVHLLLLLILCSFASYAQISTASLWTWMKESNSINQYGIYGTQGIASSFNTPLGRSSFASLKDNAEDLWLFGGTGYATSGSIAS